jgi:hypothetical protein
MFEYKELYPMTAFALIYSQFIRFLQVTKKVTSRNLSTEHRWFVPDFYPTNKDPLIVYRLRYHTFLLSKLHKSHEVNKQKVTEIYKPLVSTGLNSFLLQLRRHNDHSSHKAKSVLKYWQTRREIFRRFDLGIRLDSTCYYSVTKEDIATHHAQRCRCRTVLDAFCGAGGNSIKFKQRVEQVISCDSNSYTLSMARHNACRYSVGSDIEFWHGNFYNISSLIQADVVFLSPPWGGPDYSDSLVYDLNFDVANVLKIKGFREMIQAANKSLRSPLICQFNE